MKEQYVRWYSPNLSGNIEMLVYGDRGYPVIIFPSTKGRYYESKDFGLIETASWFIERGFIQIFALDSVDSHSWYNRSIHPAQRVMNHIWYDKMVYEELVPRVRGNTPGGKVCVAGASFGGFHALNFAFRHPDAVSHLFAMSGRFDNRSFMDGYYDDNVYFNNPVDFLPGMNHPELWKMNIVLGTSEWDICLDANLHMSDLLNRKNVPHWLDVRGWQQHDWPLWREMFPHYLSLI
ncbi:MAG: esterase family protein [Saprospiraceae bacterium]|nr:esterase family protein [Saprospiraceae bacterium]MCB0622544.1 esterase family protein [Saprospiraceae bacterium]MCB0681506.1 esterase family protein [Saprospiraceae bacterium]